MSSSPLLRDLIKGDFDFSALDSKYHRFIDTNKISETYYKKEGYAADPLYEQREEKGIVLVASSYKNAEGRVFPRYTFVEDMTLVFAIMAGNENLYEIIRQETHDEENSIKMYFDVDGEEIPLSDDFEADKKQLLETAIESIITVIGANTDCLEGDVNLSRWLIFDSSYVKGGNMKFSFHIMPNYFCSTADIWRVCLFAQEEFKKKFPEETAHFDSSIYTSDRQFRCVGSKKLGKMNEKCLVPSFQYKGKEYSFFPGGKGTVEWPRSLRDDFRRLHIVELSLVSFPPEDDHHDPLTWMSDTPLPISTRSAKKHEPVDDTKVQRALDYLSSKYTGYEWSQGSEGVLSGRNLRKKELCPIHKRVHDSDNLFVSLHEKKWMLYIHCHRSEDHSKEKLAEWFDGKDHRFDFPYYILYERAQSEWADAYLKHNDLSMFCIDREDVLCVFDYADVYAPLKKNTLSELTDPFFDKAVKLLGKAHLAPGEEETKEQRELRFRRREIIGSTVWRENVVSKIMHKLKRIAKRMRTVNELRPYIPMANNKVVNVFTREVTDFDRSWGFCGKASASLVDPSTIPPEDKQTVDDFIATSLPDDPEVRNHLLASVGCAFSGIVSNQSIYVIQGEPESGKSVFVKLFENIAGKMGSTLSHKSFSSKDKACHDSLVYKAANKRVAVIYDYQSSYVNSDRLMEWTENKISVRQIHAAQAEIENQSHLFFSMNKNYQINIPSGQAERRYAIYQFRKPPVLIDGLEGRLEKQGCKDYFFSLCVNSYMNSLGEGGRIALPQILREERRKIKNDNDYFLMWKTECLAERKREEECSVLSLSECLQSYNSWRKRNGIEKGVAPNDFGSKMRRSGFEIFQKKGINSIKGFWLRA